MQTTLKGNELVAMHLKMYEVERVVGVSGHIMIILSGKMDPMHSEEGGSAMQPRNIMLL